MTSDCDFLHNEYEPDSKVGIKVKEILVNVIEELIQLDDHIIKDIKINKKSLINENNAGEIDLGSLAGVEFAPAEESTLTLDKSLKYALILDKAFKIPLRYLPQNVITNISTVTDKIFPVGSTYTTVSWEEDGIKKGLEKVPAITSSKCKWDLLKEEEIVENSIVRNVKTWLRVL